jgi:hypothetical protein
VFFARVFRLFAYRGAMREELLIETRNNEENGPPPQPDTAPTPTPSAPQQRAAGGEKWVSPAEMKALFPDLCQF